MSGKDRELEAPEDRTVEGRLVEAALEVVDTRTGEPVVAISRGGLPSAGRSEL